jgi:hypothetical protein
MNVRIVSYLSSALILVTTGMGVQAGGTLSYQDQYLLDRLVQDELWRAAGPREGALRDLLLETLEGRNPEAIRILCNHLKEWAARGWLDVEALDRMMIVAKTLEQPGGVIDGRWLSRNISEARALASMSEHERVQFYRRVIESRLTDSATGLTWYAAAHLSLLAGADQLLPAIRSAVATAPSSRFEEVLVEDLRAVDIPVSEARTVSDPCNALVDLVAANLDPNSSSALQEAQFRPSDVVVREALLSIVWHRDCAVRQRLLDLWRSLPLAGLPRPAEIADPKQYEKLREKVMRGHAREADAGRADPEPQRRGLHAVLLTRAIRALGDPSFQRRNDDRTLAVSGDQARARLKHDGVFPASPVSTKP